jgi:hypothetical protein
MTAPCRETVLRQLFTLYQRHGEVSTTLIKQDRLLPDPAAIVGTFGSLGGTYSLGGVPMTKTVQGALAKRGVRVSSTN